MFIKYPSVQLDINNIYKNANSEPEFFTQTDITEGRLVIGECVASPQLLAIGYLTGIECKEGVIRYYIENAELGNPTFRIINAHRVRFEVVDDKVGLPLTASVQSMCTPSIGFVSACNGDNVVFLDRAVGSEYTRDVNSVHTLAQYTEED